MIHLDALHASHPSLPAWQVEAYVGCAAIALQRRHAPGVVLLLTLDAAEIGEELTWEQRPRKEALMVDDKRVTEDGAECIALALVAAHRKHWRLVRRLQSGKAEHADWLFQNVESGQEIVLEISGTDTGPFERRVRQKRGQAALAAAMGAPAISVVRFSEPKALLEG